MTCSHQPGSAPQGILEQAPGFVFAFMASLIAALGFAPPRCHAHAPPEAWALIEDGSAEVVVIVTNRGLIFRDPANDELQLMCIEALGVDSSLPPAAVVVGDGSLLTATQRGMQRSDDGGCTWQPVPPFSQANLTALVAHPDDADTLYVASAGGDNRGLYVSRDGGQSWASMLAWPEGEFVYSLAVAPSAPTHLFATATDLSQPAAPVFFALRSVDAGDSWERIQLTASQASYRYRVAAVDPKDPEHVLIRSATFDPARERAELLESRDGGATFTTSLEALEITSAAFAQDGTLWVGTAEGLFMRRADPSAPTAFARVTDASQLTCTQRTSAGLFVCGHYRGTNVGRPGVGRLTGDPDTPGVDGLLAFEQVDAPLACDPASQTAQLCEKPWHDWTVEQLGAPLRVASDAGEPMDGGAGNDAGALGDADHEDAGGSDGDGGPGTARGGAVHDDDGGCAVARAGAGRSGVFRWLVALVAYAVGRRRRP